MLTDNPRLQMMVSKLKVEQESGRIENEWVEKFICDMHVRLKQKLPISQKQTDKIEELFDKY